MARAWKRQRQRRIRWYVAIAAISVVVVSVSAYLIMNENHKPVILYINQGNGVVNGTGFTTMLSYASDHGFNTIFFQAYRQGHLLFSPETLQSFVNEAHNEGMQIYFALYITNASQALPGSIFGLREDGISLDMATATVDPSSQRAFLASLSSEFGGKTAVTTTDYSTSLRPGLLILETYAPQTKIFIRSGIVGSVGAFETTSVEDYQAQFQYALNNSDGVMVFDYAGLLRAGY